MLGRQAKVISRELLKRMLQRARRSRYPERDVVIILLSVRSGLRACEIAGLQWSMILEPSGRVGRQLSVHDRIAKKRSGRRIPLHPELRCALQQLLRKSDQVGPVITSARGGPMRPNSIVNWFVTLFRELGVEGCSSHSGRRSFITGAARALPHSGGSLRDVQLLAGHRSIETTQAYIDGDTDAQRRLIRLI